LTFLTWLPLTLLLPETHHATGHHAKAATADYTLTAENHEGTTEAKVATHTDAASHEAVTTSAHGDAHGEEVKSYAGLGLVELMILTGFLGAFLLTFFVRLSKEPLVNESDPYLKESERLTS
jgi:hypothetical protein